MTKPGLLSDWDAVKEFIFAGNATFTLVSLKTGVRFTYKVRVKKADLQKLTQEHTIADMNGPVSQFESTFTASEVVYFVNLLRGPDNTSDFAYMGVLRRNPARFFWTAASGKVGRGAPAYKALLWLVQMMNLERAVLGISLEVWHEGKCGRCRRKLSVPSSILAGLGPECQRVAA